MTKDEFKKAVNLGVKRNKYFMVVKVETEGQAKPEFIISPKENIKDDVAYYMKTYNDNLEHTRSHKLVKITDVLLTSNLIDLNWFCF